MKLSGKKELLVYESGGEVGGEKEKFSSLRGGRVLIGVELGRGAPFQRSTKEKEGVESFYHGKEAFGSGGGKGNLAMTFARSFSH